MGETQQIILAGGCFWCTEAVFRDVVGVSEVESGYIGGTTENPTYKEICTGRTGHAEAIRVSYDPDAIALDDLLDVFLGTHDPTQLNRQGNDVGTQYRSAIFPVNDEQRAAAEAAIARANEDHGGKVVTTIEGADQDGGAKWYPAEDYHQEYWEGEGKRNPYCLATIPPKLAKLRKSYAAKVKADA
ncbi:Peptide-methionine (S)-S-oxide reductase [Alteripontixanthobacter maritimus]|uniref:Peptide methionine sulfoxide reductase MsrA n=1 Tax=Alteripontixanthobacter maritimus TaxID=2161824 RepID=A0A369Q6Y5_9SPHN|nr:peptide-methionine (S)-S-oxide reductase MsrA [Alteripontixanthobacter maritimus]RDC59057.1 Peptide-methionine (S)-S-oxide reductase [Alteripontixanthobacter maritimus]